jgi:DNA segregation ATPase FtsK/SpoIIIE-like protein
VAKGGKRHVWLDRQADHVEAVLSSLALPARVCGGRVSEAGVEYRLRPVFGTEAQALLDAAGEIAQDLGVREVRASYAHDQVALQVPADGLDSLRLLPFMRSLGDLGPLTAVLGQEMDHRPALISLVGGEPSHVMVRGPSASGKSELLRVALISLALTSRRCQLALQGIDIGGRELPMIEAFPHAHTALAANPSAARFMVAELELENRRRHAQNISTPHIVLFIDDLTWLCRDRRQRALHSLLCLLEEGGSVGIHIFAALRTPAMQRLAALQEHWRARSVYPLRAIDRPRAAGHLFEIEHRRPAAAMRAAWLSAADIDEAATLVSQRCTARPSGGEQGLHWKGRRVRAGEGITADRQSGAGS